MLNVCALQRHWAARVTVPSVIVAAALRVYFFFCKDFVSKYDRMQFLKLSEVVDCDVAGSKGQRSVKFEAEVPDL